MTEALERHVDGAQAARTFGRRARAQGVRKRAVRALEPAALELFPDDPCLVLESRTAFERAATHAILGDAGNLELSYGLVDALATAVEALGLARASDVPDPFRRVWVVNGADEARRGVVLRCSDGEIAVFCSPSQRSFIHAGAFMRVSYRGFSSSVDYELRLSDAVRLPRALVLHLTRPERSGSIGRVHVRVDVWLAGTVRAADPADGDEVHACAVLDVSAGGMRIASDLTAGSGTRVMLEVDLTQGVEPPLCLPAIVRWNRTDDEGYRTQGVEFEPLDDETGERYALFLDRILPPEEGADPDEGGESGGRPSRGGAAHEEAWPEHRMSIGADTASSGALDDGDDRSEAVAATGHLAAREDVVQVLREPARSQPLALVEDPTGPEEPLEDLVVDPWGDVLDAPPGQDDMPTGQDDAPTGQGFDQRPPQAGPEPIESIEPQEAADDRARIEGPDEPFLGPEEIDLDDPGQATAEEWSQQRTAESEDVEQQVPRILSLAEPRPADDVLDERTEPQANAGAREALLSRPALDSDPDHVEFPDAAREDRAASESIDVDLEELERLRSDVELHASQRKELLRTLAEVRLEATHVELELLRKLKAHQQHGEAIEAERVQTQATVEELERHLGELQGECAALVGEVAELRERESSRPIGPWRRVLGWLTGSSGG